jgi:HTH-type transcriptional regulator/antitoxin HigA
VEEMSCFAEIEDKREYAKLLTQVLPHVIHTDVENERYIATLDVLLRKRRRTPEEDRVVELLTLLIEDFEERSYSTPRAEPREVVRHLMTANGLRQSDLVDVFGTESLVSEVLNGKRDLSKSHIARLSARFHVSPEVFFEIPPLHTAESARTSRRK